jgi:tRNA dimethylallyltransferase
LNYLITIVGPTAIGKTALSIVLSKHYNCDIISCDSRQLYKEMEIGTAVPNQEELANAKHHFIQNKSVLKPYTVGDFEKEALVKLDSLFLENNIQIMVGGSGLYVDAVLKGFDTFPEIEPTIRESVINDYEQYGIDFLKKELQNLDLAFYNKITQENPQTLLNPHRLMRFIEVCKGTGKPYSSFLNKDKNERNFIPIIIGLEADRKVLYDRINQRVDLMIAQGLEAEGQALFKHKNLNALQTVGYKEFFNFFEGQSTLDFTIEEIKKNTRRFAKRQLTWFKRDENIKWFDYKTDPKIIIECINSAIEKPTIK